MKITVTINDKDIQDRLKRLADRAGNMRACFDAIGQEYEKLVRRNFDSESDPEGRKWQRLAAYTLMRKLGKTNSKGDAWGFKKSGYLNARGKKYLQNKKILFENGDLLSSIHYTADSSSATIGTRGNIKYAAVHQFGKGRIPARPYLAMNVGTNGMRLAERDKAKIIEIIDNYIASA